MRNNNKLNNKRNREPDTKYHSTYNYNENIKRYEGNNFSKDHFKPNYLESSYYPNQNRFKSKPSNKPQYSNNTDNNSETQKKALVIPGYYYDESSNRYFPEKNFHNKEFSLFNSEKNERICKENDNNYTNPQVSQAQDKKISNFLLIKNYKLGLNTSSVKSELIMSIEKDEIDQFQLLNLKTKSLGSKYDMYVGRNKSYLLSLDNNHITIQNIIEGENDSAIMYKIYFNYVKTFTDFKVVNDFLFIFHEFKVFAVDLAEVLDNYEKSLFTFKLKLFYQNFTNNLNKICHFPGSYLWPIIRQFKSEKSFIFLFFKKIFTVDFNLIEENKVSSRSNTKETFMNHSSIDINEMIKEKSFHFIKIQTEKTFEKHFFTEINYNTQNKLFYCGESMGNVHIYDKTFKLLETINNLHEIQSSIINLIPLGKEMISIESNSNISLIQFSGKSFIKTVLYKSSLPSYFKTKKNYVIANQFLFFMNEREEYTIYDLRKMMIVKTIKKDNCVENNRDNTLYSLINKQNRKIYTLIE